MTGRQVPRWVDVADVLTVVLLATGVVVLVTGGARLQIGVVPLSVTNEARLFLLAILAGLVRHLLFRRPDLRSRIRDACGYPPVRRLLDRIEQAKPLRAQDRDFLASEGIDQRRRRRAIAATGEVLLVTAVMIGLTAYMTYPQVRHLESMRDLGDPVFSTWRLAWFAHQLPRDPLHLFDANIFYPERWTYAYNDAVLLPGLVAAPFHWLGVPAVVVYNVWILLSFVLAGVCMYMFVRALTGSRPAAAVAGVAFAFYPFRFEHYSHFEQLLSFWMPLALWALHRTVTRARLRDGLVLGAVVAAQYLSGMYLGIFLAVYLVPLGGALALGWNRARQAWRPLLAGGALAALLVVPAVLPYLPVRAELGERLPDEVRFYSPKADRYLVPHYDNVAYGDPLGDNKHAAETDLFPGLLIVGLAIVAIWPPLSVPRVAYLLALIFAFDASLGSYGLTYPILYKWVFPFRGLRVPARFSMLVGLSLSVLAAYGTARILARIRGRWVAGVLAAALCAGILFECRSAMNLRQVWEFPRIYRSFEHLPAGAVAELPPPGERAFTETRYMYFSMRHWNPLLNGYSGAFPPSWAMFKVAMADFPDDRSVQFLKARGARYVVLHEDGYGMEKYREILRAADSRADLKEVARTGAPGDGARIYKILR